jgi:uncharacterized membrane protein
MSTDADRPADGGGQKRGGGRRGAWTVPVTAAVLGAAFLAIYLGHGDPGMAVSGLVVMLAYAAVLVFGSRRSEAVSLLRGQTSDERGRSIEQRASALTLHVLSVVLVGGYVVSIIRGTGEMTWASLCGVLGGVYLLSMIVLTRRG